MAQNKVVESSADLSENGRCTESLQDHGAEVGKDLSATDAEVSEILQCDAEEEIDDSERNVVVTEVIMAKTFTESIAPDREFMPIGGEVGVEEWEAPIPTLSSNLSPETAGVGNLSSNGVVPTARAGDQSDGACSSKLTGSIGIPEQSIPDGSSVDGTANEASETRNLLVGTKTTSESNEEASLQSARGELHGLSDDFRKLLSLLDEMSSFSRYSQYACSSDDDDEEEKYYGNASQVAAGGENQVQDSVDTPTTVLEKPRVVYRYRVKNTVSPSTGGKRWINRPRSGETDYSNVAAGYSFETAAITTAMDPIGFTTTSPCDDSNSADNSTVTATPDRTDDGAVARDLVSVTVEVRTPSS